MKIQMIASAAEFIAGEEYEVDDATGDRFVLLGYADGVPSRDYSESERAALRELVQEVQV